MCGLSYSVVRISLGCGGLHVRFSYCGLLINCNNVEHKEALKKYYDDIMFAITSAGRTTIKTRNRSNGKNLNRPGWKEFASELYDMSRET